MKPFKTIEHRCDFCVVGGGLAGTIAALAAARRGVKVVLIQDRPVLGGNSSSEIRMWVRGARGKYNRETGILAEFEEENIYRNATLAHPIWDSVLFGKVKENRNIELLLNASCFDADCENDEIKSVTAWQLTTYTYHKVYAKFFADCSGDGILAPLTGALYKIGREGRDEYGEEIAPPVADSMTMGMSILLQARETNRPVPFIPPSWAYVYPSDEDFAYNPYLKRQYSTIRDHNIGTSGCNLWWIELGGDGEAIANTEEVRDELLKVAFGIWDHIKNRGDHGCENWELEWVGFLPGKRESVRYIGEYILTQHDIEAGGRFPDIVAYGGWPLDDHNPLGMKAKNWEDSPSNMVPVPSPYGIPYRCLYSKNIKNLLFAGRNISVTHAALSSTRVMGTCSLLGQAVGTSVALCCRLGLLPRDLQTEHIQKLQQNLLEDGVFLPGIRREISELSKIAKLNLSDSEKDILFNGIERPRNETGRNHVVLNPGECIEFVFDEEKEIGTLRIQFDPDSSRQSVSPNFKMQIFALKLHCGLDFVPVRVPNTIVKSFEVRLDDEVIYSNDQNYHSLVKIPINKKGKKVCVRFIETHGAEKVNIFACDLIDGSEQ